MAFEGLARRFAGLPRLEQAAVIVWYVALLAVLIRAAVAPHRQTVYPVMRAAAQNWMAGADLYPDVGVFRYSPPVAAAFVGLAVFPDRVAGVLWRLINAGVLLGAMAWWLRYFPPHRAASYRWGLGFLCLLPLSLGSLNNAQANPLVIGLLLAGVVAARTARWTLAAVCITGATYFKVYPLAVGLLLALVYPRRFAWRLVAALALFWVASLVLQRPAYVLHQYRDWIASVQADNRMELPLANSYRDVWLLLRLAHAQVSQHAYLLVQLGTAAGVAVVVLAGRWQRWPEGRLLTALFGLACGWMMAFGPATESSTYTLFAPAVVTALLLMWERPAPPALRAVVLLSFGLLVAAQIANWFPFVKKVHAMGLQPVAALLFLAAMLVIAWRPSLWEGVAPRPPDVGAT